MVNMNEATPIHETAMPPEAAIEVPVTVPPARVWRQPAVLTLPDWKGASAAHWLTHWEQQHGLRRVAQHDWLRPLRGDWMMQLQEAVLAHEHCHLLAHGLGGHLIDAWLRHTRQASRVLSVVLVDPIDLHDQQMRETLFTWKPLPPQKWALPVGLLWKERPPNPQLQGWLEASGIMALDDSGQALGAGTVAGWSVVDAFWRDHDPAAGLAHPEQPATPMTPHDTPIPATGVGTPE